MNPWLILAVVLAFAAGAVTGEWDGRARTEQKWTANIEKERADSFKAGREIERNQQEKANEAMRQQNANLADNNARLERDLERLRKRPARPHVAGGVPAPAEPACPGATGAELYREDGIFLRREAARADAVREGLRACYQTLDAIGD